MLRDEVVACRACPRLVTYRERVARERKREFRDEPYWGRPVPGFGDPHARLVVIGLAPAAHGSNRTGRVFTGDRSASFLVGGLYKAGFASQPTSVPARGRPPLPGPLPHRRGPMRPSRQPPEAGRTGPVPPLPRARVPPPHRDPGLPGPRRFRLGRDRSIAVRAVYEIDPPKVPFGHGACAPLGPGLPLVWGSYHPSPQNTNTGRFTQAMFVDLLLPDPRLVVGAAPVRRPAAAFADSAHGVLVHRPRTVANLNPERGPGDRDG